VGAIGKRVPREYFLAENREEHKLGEDKTICGEAHTSLIDKHMFMGEGCEEKISSDLRGEVQTKRAKKNYGRGETPCCEENQRMSMNLSYKRWVGRKETTQGE